MKLLNYVNTQQGKNAIHYFLQNVAHLKDQGWYDLDPTEKVLPCLFNFKVPNVEYLNSTDLKAQNLKTLGIVVIIHHSIYVLKISNFGTPSLSLYIF